VVSKEVRERYSGSFALDVDFPEDPADWSGQRLPDRALEEEESASPPGIGPEPGSGEGSPIQQGGSASEEIVAETAEEGSVVSDAGAAQRSPAVVAGGENAAVGASSSSSGGAENTMDSSSSSSSSPAAAGQSQNVASVQLFSNPAPQRTNSPQQNNCASGQNGRDASGSFDSDSSRRDNASVSTRWPSRATSVGMDWRTSSGSFDAGAQQQPAASRETFGPNSGRSPNHNSDGMDLVDEWHDAETHGIEIVEQMERGDAAHGQMERVATGSNAVPIQASGRLPTLAEGSQFSPADNPFMGAGEMV
jgi:hypothetical protein